MTIEERFFEKVRKTETCWEWIGGYSHGYGQFFDGEKATSAHRFSYELHKGPLQKGRAMHVDHLCNNTKCVNPEHLEYVHRKTNLLRSKTPSAINARKTHCIHGHEFTSENTRIDKVKFGFMRSCRICKNKLSKEYSRVKREKEKTVPIKKRIYFKKSHCIHGHIFDEENTYIHNNKQHCRKCRSKRFKIFQEKKK